MDEYKLLKSLGLWVQFQFVTPEPRDRIKIGQGHGGFVCGGGHKPEGVAVSVCQSDEFIVTDVEFFEKMFMFQCLRCGQSVEFLARNHQELSWRYLSSIETMAH